MPPQSADDTTARYTVTDLVTAIKKARESGATSFNFIIDSDGGYVNEGFAMAQVIEGLKEPTKSTAIRVFSIANVIYFAADERTTEKRSTFMLHQAMTTASGNSDELRGVADMLDLENARIASYISKRTGLDVGALKGLMSTDRYIHEGEAKELGFFGSGATALQMVALYRQKQNSTMSKIDEALKTIKAYFMGEAVNMEDEATPEEAVNMDIELEDGNTIFVESEDGELEGKATNAPDGTHRLRDGRSITVADGVVQSVQEGESEEAEGMDDDEEKQAMRDKIAQLEAQLQEASAMTQEKEESYNKLSEEVMNIKKMISSNASPLVKHPRFNQANQNPKQEAEAYKPKLVGAAALRAKVLKR